MKVALLLTVLALAGCSTPPLNVRVVHDEQEQQRRIDRAIRESQRPPNPKCPPLPRIPDDADREEGRLFTFTVIELYRQCAESKR